jgi:hypothetical protein
MKAVMVAADYRRRSNMTPIITPSELEPLTETELKSKFCDLQAFLAFPRSAEEVSDALISLNNIRQAIRRRRTMLEGHHP